MSKKVILEENNRRMKEVDPAYNSLMNSNDYSMQAIWFSADCVFLNQHLFNLLSAFKPLDSIRVLDAGCGSGYVSNFLSAVFENAKFDCVDSESSRFKYYYHPRLKFIEADLLEFSTAHPYDFIICSEVFEHVSDYNHLILTLSKSLKPGGFLSLSTPSGWMWRLPRISNLVSIKADFSRYKKLYLQPEKNWGDALLIHPAIQPSKLIKLMKAEGFKLKRRGSSIYYLVEATSIILRLHKIFPEAWVRNFIFNFFTLMDALMNAIPPARVFESRQVLLFQKSLVIK